MISEKKEILRPILESSGGTHLTIYLQKSPSFKQMKNQLKDAIDETMKWLEPVMSISEREKFIEPVKQLIKETSVLKKIKTDVGLFRTSDSFRLLSVPVQVQTSCIVATSFHVKPLLRWMQFDRDFLLLGLNNTSASLHISNQHSSQKIDEISISRSMTYEQVSELINAWLLRLTPKHAPPLFVVGPKRKVSHLMKSLKYRSLVKTPIEAQLSKVNLNKVLHEIRIIFKQDAEAQLSKALSEFRLADEINLTRKNIFQIAKAAVQGRVRKLIIAEGINVFGKIDKKTGGIAIHPFDLDHEDDDLLDDIAQEVLSHGGEVIVAAQEDMPKGRPILAILEGSQVAEKTTTTNNYFSYSPIS